MNYKFFFNKNIVFAKSTCIVSKVYIVSKVHKVLQGHIGSFEQWLYENKGKVVKQQ